MKRALALAILIFLAPMLQGALSPFWPAALRPDLPLLLLFGLSLCWRNSASGMLLATVIGFVVDLFSGALLGQHALLYVLIFTGARLLSGHVNLIGPLAQMLFAATLTAVHAAGLAVLTAFFAPGGVSGLLRPDLLLLSALANALLAPLVTPGVAVLVAWIAGEDGGRRLLRLAPRSWST